jgi:hypothetical protein
MIRPALNWPALGSPAPTFAAASVRTTSASIVPTYAPCAVVVPCTTTRPGRTVT